MSEKPILRAVGVKKSYYAGKRELPVLRGIDFSMHKGECVLMYGPSGAGKSTLLHILGLIDVPTEGTLYLEEENITAIPANRRAQLRNEKFGFVFQFYHLLPDFSALENVMLPLLMRNGLLGWFRGKKKAKKRAEELLEIVGLKDRIHHKPSELSGGERQRVAIARALITEPQVLFLDEPTGNLDTKTADSILTLLKEMKNRFSQTFLMATHNKALVSFGTRVINIVDGKIVGEESDGAPKS
ncbi:MAG: ABC transporter ATP-binding protein [Planctomycetota bacterium]|nr:ABC transporter ATP-binding protein [Planctomycetota bacterium]